MEKPTCDAIQKSLDWCEGRPQHSGIRRRIYYTAFSNVVSVPHVPLDENKRPVSGVLAGELVMKEGAVFYGIDIVPERSQPTSASQGDYPNQTSLDKLVAVHPGVGSEASAAAAYIHNTRNIYVFEDIDGRARMLGFEESWPSKGTVEMDFGQGPAGTTGTTITVESTNRVPFPEYRGKIMTEEGEIDYSKNS